MPTSARFVVRSIYVRHCKQIFHLNGLSEVQYVRLRFEREQGVPSQTAFTLRAIRGMAAYPLLGVSGPAGSAGGRLGIGSWVDPISRAAGFVPPHPPSGRGF